MAYKYHYDDEDERPPVHHPDTILDDPRVGCCTHPAHHTSVETALQPCAECQAEHPYCYTCGQRHAPVDGLAALDKFLQSCGFDMVAGDNEDAA